MIWDDDFIAWKYCGSILEATAKIIDVGVFGLALGDADGAPLEIYYCCNYDLIVEEDGGLI